MQKGISSIQKIKYLFNLFIYSRN